MTLEKYGWIDKYYLVSIIARDTNILENKIILIFLSIYKNV